MRKFHLDLYYKIDERLDIKVVAEYYYFGSLDRNQRNHAFLDVEATCKLKGDQWTLGLRGNNLFNKTNFTTYYVLQLHRLSLDATLFVVDLQVQV